MNKFIFYVFILPFICVSFAFGMKEENNFDRFKEYLKDSSVYIDELLKFASDLPELDPSEIDKAIEKLTEIVGKVNVLEESMLSSFFGKEYEEYKIKESPIDFAKQQVDILYQSLKPLKTESKTLTYKKAPFLKQWIFSDVNTVNYEEKIPSGRYLLRFLFISNLMKYLKLQFLTFYISENNIEGEKYIKSLINILNRQKIDFAEEMNGWYEDLAWKTNSIEVEIFLKYIENTNNNKIHITVNDAHRYIIVEVEEKQKKPTHQPIRNIWIEQKIWQYLNDILSKHFKILEIPQNGINIGFDKIFPHLQDENLKKEEEESRLKYNESLSNEAPQKSMEPKKKKKKKTPKKKTIKNINNNQNQQKSGDIPNYFSSEDIEKIQNLPQNQTGYSKFKFTNKNPNEQKRKYTLNYVNKSEPKKILKKAVTNSSNEPKKETTDYYEYLYGELDSINYQIFENMIESLNDLRNIILFVVNKPLISNKKMSDLIKKYIVALYDNKYLYNKSLEKINFDQLISTKLNSFKKYNISNDLKLSAIPENVVFDIDIFDPITNSSDYFNNGYYLYLDKLQEPYDNSIQFDHRSFLGEVSTSVDAERYVHLINFHYEIIDKYWQLQNIIAEYLLVSLGLIENPEAWIKKEALDKWQSFFNNLENTAINLNQFWQKMLFLLESKS